MGFEEQFYAVVGLLVLTCGRRWLLGAVLVTLTTIAAVVLWPTNVVHGFFWDGNWTLFACGVAVYAYRQQARVWIPIALACALAWSLWHVASVKEAMYPCRSSSPQPSRSV